MTDRRKSGSNARKVAARLVRGWNLPPGMRPGDESPSEPAWEQASPQSVYEEADPEKLDEAIQAEIAFLAPRLTGKQVQELAEGDYYSPVAVDLDWDSATLWLELRKPTDIARAPRIISVRIDNPFTD